MILQVALLDQNWNEVANYHGMKRHDANFIHRYDDYFYNEKSIDFGFMTVTGIHITHLLWCKDNDPCDILPFNSSIYTMNGSTINMASMACQIQFCKNFHRINKWTMKQVLT